MGILLQRFAAVSDEPVHPTELGQTLGATKYLLGTPPKKSYMGVGANFRILDITQWSS